MSDIVSTDKLLRARLIESGNLRPNHNELDPIQLPPGTVVFRICSGTRGLAVLQ